MKVDALLTQQAATESQQCSAKSKFTYSLYFQPLTLSELGIFVVTGGMMAMAKF